MAWAWTASPWLEPQRSKLVAEFHAELSNDMLPGEHAAVMI